MPNQYRVQRPTLTYAQMDGAGHQEGMGIWGDFSKWIKGASKKTKKFLKKTKLVSRLGTIAAPIAGALGQPGVSAAIAVGSKFAKQHGYGPQYRMGKPPRYGSGKLKNITPAQMKCLQMGYGHKLKTGGVSLASARLMYPQVKNITSGQVKALSQGRGRYMKGGGVSLPGGSGYSGMGAYGGRYGGRYAGRSANVGQGIKLAGQGVQRYKKKRIYRRKPQMVHRY